MRVAIECAGFTATEADQLRRSMATFKFTGGISVFRDKLIAGMVQHGYDREFSERTFKQLEGFGSYGFPESHAASFALIAYASSWMKCHHPEVFCAALLNAQPMGFYAPAQIVRDAIEHGVEVRPADVNHSRWDCTLENASEGKLAVRLGLRMARGLANEQGSQIALARADEPYTSVDDVWRRASVGAASLAKLAHADAFQSLHLSRREAIWEIEALADEPLPLFAAADQQRPLPEIVEPPVELASMTAGREVVEDYSTVGLTLRAHPVTFLRQELTAKRIRPCRDITAARDGDRVEVAGLVLVRQRPGSAKGVMFITIEDEHGIANLVIWPKLFDRQRKIILSASMLGVWGKVQREGEVIHLVAHRLTDLSAMLRSVGDRDQLFTLPHGRGDEAKTGGSGDQRDAKAKGLRARDIYIPDLHIHSGIKVKTRDFR